MQLTRFTDLGLRVLMYLNQQERNPPVTVAEIAAQFDVPHNHLVKVVNRLGKLGWISTQRGRSGGLRLAVVPQEVRVGQILRALEDKATLIDCASPPCVLDRRCQLKLVLDEALAAFYAHLDQYTLADMSGSRTGEALIVLHRQFLAAKAVAQA